MTFLSRACTLYQGRRYLSGLMTAPRNLPYLKYTCNNAKILASRLDMRNFCSANDKIHNEDKQLIYTGYLTAQLRNLKFFSVVSSTICIACQPLIFAESDLPLDSASTFVMLALFNIWSVGTPFLLHFTSKSYVTDMYYLPKEDKYLAYVFTLLVQKKQLEFKPEEVVVPESAGPMTTCLIGSTPLFFNQNQLESNHYAKLMGCEKPDGAGKDEE